MIVDDALRAKHRNACSPGFSLRPSPCGKAAVSAWRKTSAALCCNRPSPSRPSRAASGSLFLIQCLPEFLGRWMSAVIDDRCLTWMTFVAVALPVFSSPVRHEFLPFGEAKLSRLSLGDSGAAVPTRVMGMSVAHAEGRDVGMRGRPLVRDEDASRMLWCHGSLGHTVGPLLLDGLTPNWENEIASCSVTSFQVFGDGFGFSFYVFMWNRGCFVVCQAHPAAPGHASHGLSADNLQIFTNSRAGAMCLRKSTRVLTSRREGRSPEW